METFLAVYTIGYIVSYLTLKFANKQDTDTWTRRDRIIGLITSLLSWLAVFIVVIMIAQDWFQRIDERDSWDKPAKW